MVGRQKIIIGRYSKIKHPPGGTKVDTEEEAEEEDEAEDEETAEEAEEDEVDAADDDVVPIIFSMAIAPATGGASCIIISLATRDHTYLPSASFCCCFCCFCCFFFRVRCRCNLLMLRNIKRPTLRPLLLLL